MPVTEPLVAPDAPIAISTTAAPSSSRRGWIILGGVIFAAVVGAAAFIGLNNSGALAPHHDITGSFELIDTNTSFSSISTSGSTCKGTGGYGDIGPGTNATLKDGDGKILATGSLGQGAGNATHCSFAFALPAVPEAPFYQIEVGHRGGLTYSLADMQGFGWTLSLTLGN
jgi:hypothetical protein